MKFVDLKAVLRHLLVTLLCANLWFNRLIRHSKVLIQVPYRENFFGLKQCICKINSLDLLSNPRKEFLAAQKKRKKLESKTKIIKYDNEEYYQELLDNIIEETIHSFANKNFTPTSCYDLWLTSVIGGERNN